MNPEVKHEDANPHKQESVIPGGTERIQARKVYVPQVDILETEQALLLVDQSKFGKTATYAYGTVADYHTVITDTGASDSAVQLLEHYGVRVITVEPEAVDPRVVEASAMSSHD